MSGPAPGAPHGPIAHVITESVPFGGAQRNTLLTVQGLLRRGHEVELVCGAPGGRLVEEARVAGAAAHVLPHLVRTTAPAHDVRCFAAMRRLFRERGYRVVHTHSTKAGLLGRIAARAAGVPVIVHTVHGFPFVLDRSLRSRIFVQVERFAGRFADASVCVAEALRAEVEGWKLPPRHRIVTIYSGIDFSACASTVPAASVRRALGLADAWPIIGSVGHLRDAKSQEHLIEAAGILREKHPALRLLIVGDGERREFLERRIHELDLHGTVRLLGERSDVADLLAIFDVYAMSSLWEGVGRALTEAMYRGLPVVVTPVYGVKELVRDGETGLTVPTRDPRALARAIDRLLGDRSLAARLGANAHRLVVEKMAAERMIEAIESLYAELGRDAAPERALGATSRCAELREG